MSEAKQELLEYLLTLTEEQIDKLAERLELLKKAAESEEFQAALAALSDSPEKKTDRVSLFRRIIESEATFFDQKGGQNEK